MSGGLVVISTINATLELAMELNEMLAMLQDGEVSEAEVEEALRETRETNERNRQIVSRLNRQRRLKAGE